ncbi:DUF1835 domain-containing protein [Zunongwangia sp.]|uniref:DUF1835 domain-containing protein n=1 Tax=Zunongwangia sp. TaxID=1965325 RepID=UPI003AA8055B
MKENKALHIIHGDSLADNFSKLALEGEKIIWREMLCEGPTSEEVGTDAFFKMRQDFLKEYYGVSNEDYQHGFVDEFKRFQAIEDYDHIVLWFEFDLFCHINLLAAVYYFTNFKKQVPVYLVCSKKLKGEKSLTPLSHLNTAHLLQHFKQKILLTEKDLEVSNFMWELYCSNDPQLLKLQIKTKTNFEYLSSSIRAHIERFPNSITGINSLERNILRLIDLHTISNETQLLGYALEYQGYYGYADIQMQRVLQQLAIFYTLADNRIVLTEAGQQVLDKKKNFYRNLTNNDIFGGARKYDFLYEQDNHHLLKL